MERKRLTANGLDLEAKDVSAAKETEYNFEEMNKTLADAMRTAGLRQRAEHFSVSLMFETYPEFRIFAGVQYPAETLDYIDAVKFSKDIYETSRRIQKSIDIFRKKYPKVKVVPYPYPA